MKIVVDANVIVSALFGGHPRAAVLSALNEETFISREIVDELTGLRDKLAKKISPFQLRRWTDLFLPAILGGSTLVSRVPTLHICRDPKDDAYLSLAKAAEAEYLITGDKDLLESDSKRLTSHGLAKLSIVSPADFIKIARR